jgi:hypothetical protein
MPTPLKTPNSKASTGHCLTPSDFVQARLKFKKKSTETSYRTLSGPTEHCLALTDIVWILNLSPTASFLGEPYKYPSTSNGSPLLATVFYCC